MRPAGPFVSLPFFTAAVRPAGPFVSWPFFTAAARPAGPFVSLAFFAAAVRPAASSFAYSYPFIFFTAVSKKRAVTGVSARKGFLSESLSGMNSRSVSARMRTFKIAHSVTTQNAAPRLRLDNGPEIASPRAGTLTTSFMRAPFEICAIPYENCPSACLEPS